MSVLIKILFLFFFKVPNGFNSLIDFFIQTAKARLGGDNGEDCRIGVGGIEIQREVGKKIRKGRKRKRE